MSPVGFILTHCQWRDSKSSRFKKYNIILCQDEMSPVPGHPDLNPDRILRGMGGFLRVGFRKEL